MVRMMVAVTCPEIIRVSSMLGTPGVEGAHGVIIRIIGQEIRSILLNKTQGLIQEIYSKM